MKTVALVLSVLALAWAGPQGAYNYRTPPGLGQGYGFAPAQYSFQWDVDHPPSGNFYGHQEHRDGDVTRGSYYVLLPDTRLMRVEYYVDQTGYHPTVTFEGEAQFPSGPGTGYYRPGVFPGRTFPGPVHRPQLPLPTPSQRYASPGK
ncbi:pupal cuticle protein Edg-84A-like [Panulirus ornatus]|uniref:pupal cuticle protein Edg-84A-like n=1 Tax=Panulirus ornatus TaxID=150431 RepID=UPI003A8C3C79